VQLLIQEPTSKDSNSQDGLFKD